MIKVITEDVKSIVTPEEAQELIERYEAQMNSENGFKNRKPYVGSVRNYSKEMMDGRWLLNGETIKLDKNGVPYDGLNRLTAIVESGVPMECFITQLQEDAKVLAPTVDTGRKRSVENALAFQGEMYERGVVSILRYHKVLQKGGLCIGQSDINNGFTHQYLIDEYRTNKDAYCEAARFARMVCAKTPMKVADVGGIYMHLIYDLGWDADKVEEFFRKLRNVAPATDEGIFQRTYLNLNDKNVRNVERTEIYMKCWNNWVKGNRVKLVAYTDHFFTESEINKVA